MSIYRSRTLKVFLFMLLISIASVGVMLTLSSAAAEPIKIMPCGDSVTAGIGDPYMGSYRTDLYTYYKNAGLSFDFVGSQSGGPGSLPDKNHEGHSGWTIPQVAGNINNWIRTYNPDVILLWIGGNDMLQTGAPNPNGLSSLIDQITNLKPNLILFVADYYALPASNPMSKIVPQYNAAIPGIVRSKYNAGKKVYFVKLSDAALARSDYATDNLHLSPGGYSKIAAIWNNSTTSIIRSIQITPTPTPTPTLTPTPTPTPKPLVGDLNGDTSVDAADYALMKMYLLGSIKDFPVQDDLAAGDLNLDGVINILDFDVFKKYLLGIIPKLPYKL